MKLNFCKINL